MPQPHWKVFDNAEQVAAEACERILAAAQQAIAERGAFHLVLAGGSTPERCYRRLARQPADWSRWHIYFGDERCLPADHAERNSRMAAQALTDQVPIPAEQIHPITAELGAKPAAIEYAARLPAILPFDLVLLGMGEDGHTASLFPGHAHPADALVVAVYDAPKPPPERVSLNRPALERCRELLLLITGSGKREALRRWRAGEDLPIASLHPEGEINALVDRACW